MMLQISSLRNLARNCSPSPSPIGLVGLTFVFILLFGGYGAQDSDIEYQIPIIVIGSIIGGVPGSICICCCCVMNIVAIVYFCKNKLNRRTPSTSHTITHPSQSGPEDGIREQPHLEPSTTLVSLPEATLHRGDAPPAYKEAVTMKTVDIEDLNNTY